jgi:hypothetical protein
MRLDVLQAQWVIVALGIGIALALGLCAGLMAMRRPRDEARAREIGERGGSSWAQVFGAIPWVLWLTFIGMAVYGVVALAFYMMNPPNV